MQTANVPPNQTLAIPYTLPPSVNVLIWVRATVPVDVFVVDPDGLAAFQSNRAFTSWGGSTGLREHSLSLVLPWRSAWHLLIKNPSMVFASVQYDVVIAPPYSGSGSYGPTGPYGPTGSRMPGSFG